MRITENVYIRSMGKIQDFLMLKTDDIHSSRRTLKG
jgi:hypothetical protein